jgi:hypothetical protein
MGTILPIDKMTTEEKIQVMETHWDDLCKQADNIPSPSWHREVLQVREREQKKEMTSSRTGMMPKSGYETVFHENKNTGLGRSGSMLSG